MNGHRIDNEQRRAARRAGAAGFSLIELIVVLVVIGILAAIAIPAMYRLKSRAREAAVKQNMHLVQTAVEDFAVLSTGRYPDNGIDVSDDGRTVQDLCPGNIYPTNPFTNSPSVLVWDANPSTSNAGEIGLNPATSSSYVIRAAGGTGALLNMTLSTGGI